MKNVFILALALIAICAPQHARSADWSIFRVCSQGLRCGSVASTAASRAASVKTGEEARSSFSDLIDALRAKSTKTKEGGRFNVRASLNRGWENVKQWWGEHKEEVVEAAAVVIAITAAIVSREDIRDGSNSRRGYFYERSRSRIDGGLPFTRSQKAEILRQNMERNGGVLKSDLSGAVLSAPQQYRAGVAPSPLEAQVDHIYPRSLGGANSAENAQVLGRGENIQKSNHVK